MKTIHRIGYIDQLKKYFDKELILVLIGQRRVGKSCIMQMLKSQLIENEENNVIDIDKEKHEYDHIKTYTDLNAYISAHFCAQKKNYILVDEVQEVAEFERSVRSWRTEPNTNVILTGSNASMFSTELATLLSGRSHEFRVESLSYCEFLQFYNISDSDESLEKYIEYGGMPGLVHFANDITEARNYQSDIYHTVLVKDVLTRNEIRNVSFLERFVQFIADNVGKTISVNSICKYLKSQGETVTAQILSVYIKHLINAYIIRSAKRYDIHGKKLLETNEKYYFTDHGIRNAIAGGTRHNDIEKVIENIVYIELLRLGYEVFVGQLRTGEIDFVATKNDGSRTYVQVTYLIADHSTYEREFGALKTIKDNHPKYVVSMNPLNSRSNEDGIIHLHLRRFLTKGFAE